ncbi:hypothetical protein MKW92_051088 [Papaver armeniacum]|nr:hypothetical protein MKW92_051088 [Papaver armeniacum]
MSSFKATLLVVAMSLCLLLLGFSYSVEAAARPITDVAEAATNQQCDFRYYCLDEHDPGCNNTCIRIGYRGGNCLLSGASSNPKEKIDVNYFKVVNLGRCCCYH